ncbi:MAG: BMP family protein [Anaerolineaceae bacterium]|nr:BMP family protein [Anaerolineaceae bacterium]
MAKKLLYIAVSMLIVLTMVVGCAPKAAGTGGTTGEAGKIKVFGAFATPIEEPWDGAVHGALLKAQENGLIEYTYTENIGYAGDMERVLREACEQEKPDIIVGDSYGNEEAARRVAADYPEIAFAFGSGGGPVDPNFSVFDNWLQEAGYLAGMLAAGMSESGIVGIVAAQPVPEVNRIVNACQEGALEVNPDIKTKISYINSWFDPAAAKEAALAQIAQGADVLYAERYGVIDAAKEKGVYAIGMMVDQYEQAPEYVLSSVAWDWYPTIEYLVKTVSAGAYTAQDLKDFSMFAKGGAFLAPYHDTESKIPTSLKDLVEAKEEAIRNGSFRVNINDTAPVPIE